MAVPTITCRVSCAGSRRTSAFTTSITCAVEFPAIGCRMYCGITRSSPPSDESPCSRACSVHRSPCGTRMGGVWFHLERRPWWPVGQIGRQIGSRTRALGLALNCEYAISASRPHASACSVMRQSVLPEQGPPSRDISIAAPGTIGSRAHWFIDTITFGVLA